MPLIRGHHSFDDKYTQIPNDWLRDTRLGLKSIGLLAQIMSHSPGWEMSISSLSKQNKNGRDSIRGAIQELEQFGYLVRTQQRVENNRYGEIVYITNDPTPVDFPLSGNPSTGKPSTENPTHKNNIFKEEQLLEQQKKKYDYSLNFDKFWEKFPRKDNKIQAAKAFERLMKSGQDFDVVLAGLDSWLEHPDKKDKQFWPHGATWLNNRRFDDSLRVVETNKSVLDEFRKRYGSR
jgi:hypothetical protein